MTGVTFHVNLADRLGYACRLLRKATGSGARVIVTGEAQALRALDSALWTFSSFDFIAHGLADELPAPALAHTPVILSTTARGMPHQEVLVNLGETVPEGFEGYDRLIELVSNDPQQLQLGRQRWKYYADRGYALTKVDPSQVAA